MWCFKGEKVKYSDENLRCKCSNFKSLMFTKLKLLNKTWSLEEKQKVCLYLRWNFDKNVRITKVEGLWLENEILLDQVFV